MLVGWMQRSVPYLLLFERDVDAILLATSRGRFLAPRAPLQV